MSKTFYTTIGLEIHAELSTKSKMFCACFNDPNEKKPNTNICPVCMAHPGTLPVPNKAAIENVIKVGLAIGGKIADFTEFDRKNYFYPDIPKGYQISQYKFPIVSGGHLADFDVTRIHLEEDTGTSKHDRGDFSLVDFNRAGVPLMELVTEPHTFDSAELASKAAGRFARELQLLLLALGVSEANMDKGEMRVEVNMSVSDDKSVYGTKVEVKNLNSFRSAERAILFETDRMIKLIEASEGDKIVQETRGWNEAKQATFSQRSKENANDYRYFPDPDIPKLYLSKLFDIENLKSKLPELPAQKRERYRNDFGIKDEDIESFVNDSELGLWFEDVAKLLGDKDKIKTASNYITSDFLGLKKSNPEVKIPSYKNFSELVYLVSEGKISSRAAKDILAMISLNDESPLKIATEKDLLQKNDEGALKEIVQKIIDANPEIVATYKGGKENALMSLVGAVMKESKGSANPAIVQKILKEVLQ
ncbi:MAG: Asp-tRNA(Asn)/Glu-tRNA(Gln) amidotransferase subunit GatB [Candidatus Pacebacteria bacterium]|nr:Asp-tRNA(Asn)/Glu-tRNA(Gln) amidotransferase subunit GatB [Candidatus Paceibacterota bacterium]MBP9772567.1 Asp-tRNA(Asn)/Glu-tRNA(Gln) amidotransferase subunit GatB [Candidatus Paceibacterota bacterium]